MDDPSGFLRLFFPLIYFSLMVLQVYTKNSDIPPPQIFLPDTPIYLPYPTILSHVHIYSFSFVTHGVFKLHSFRIYLLVSPKMKGFFLRCI